MNTIQLKDLSIGYKLHNGKTKTIASHINASVESGMLTCLIGRNGTGKSTLLRTMTGFIPPLEGQVILEGRDLSMSSATERARIISIVLTERPETDNITVNELVGMGRLPYTNFWGTLQEEDRQIVDDAMQMIGQRRQQDSQRQRQRYQGGYGIDKKLSQHADFHTFAHQVLHMHPHELHQQDKDADEKCHQEKPKKRLEQIQIHFLNDSQRKILIINY